LGRDAHPVSGPADAALQDVGDVQFLCNLRDLNLLALEGKRRRARDHEQVSDLAELVDQLFGHAIGEVLLRRVAAHVGEGQDGDGFAVQDLGCGG
jgi:hypothetical protein